MKTKITLLIGAVALVTLSFTFASVENPSKKADYELRTPGDSAPVGGLIADEIVK